MSKQWEQDWESARRCAALGHYEKACEYMQSVITDPTTPSFLIAHAAKVRDSYYAKQPGQLWRSIAFWSKA